MGTVWPSTTISMDFFPTSNKRYTFFPPAAVEDAFSGSISLSSSTADRLRFESCLCGCGISTNGVMNSSHARALALNCGCVDLVTLVKARSGACRFATREPRVEGAITFRGRSDHECPHKVDEIYSRIRDLFTVLQKCDSISHEFQAGSQIILSGQCWELQFGG